MKKITMLLVASLSTAMLLGCEKDDKVITTSALPDTAQTFLETYFASATVNRVVKDYDDFKHTYEVYLSDGSFVEFDSKGRWEDVECRITGVPEGIVPAAIWQYVETNYPDRFITAIEYDDREYDVELDDRRELTFDKDGNFLYLDD